MKLYRVWFKGHSTPELFILADSPRAAKKYAWDLWEYQYGDKMTKFKLRTRWHLGVEIDSGMNRKLTKKEYIRLRICSRCNLKTDDCGCFA